MALNLGSPWISRLPNPSQPRFLSASHNNKTTAFLFLLIGNNNRTAAAISLLSRCSGARAKSGNDVVSVNQGEESLLDDALVARVSSVTEASQVLEIIAAEKSDRNSAVLSSSDCCKIIAAAIDRNNSDLAISVFHAMRRSSFHQDKSMYLERWRWSRPDVNTFTILILSLAAALRVSDSLKVIGDICRVRVSPGEEVPFGKVVRCPTCMIAVAVAQPQHGTQLVSCSKCRYQYELVSGDIVDIESEEIRLIQTPSGAARTHRFATETTDLPAQQGERVTITLATPSNVYREVGPFKFSPRAKKNYPEEPLCLTNHRDGKESTLLRAPTTSNNNVSLTNPSIVFPLVAVLASGDAASGLINPNLPQILSVLTLGSLAIGATLNTVVFPQLSQLPQRTVDVIAIKQMLLAQYDVLQTRINELRVTAENEVWMLARMHQLENKIVAIGEPSYR
ncbi:hypothetical protein V2J09_014624 [Rumex salicifolius]